MLLALLRVLMRPAYCAIFSMSMWRELLPCILYDSALCVTLHMVYWWWDDIHHVFKPYQLTQSRFQLLPQWIDEGIAVIMSVQSIFWKGLLQRMCHFRVIAKWWQSTSGMTIDSALAFCTRLQGCGIKPLIKWMSNINKLFQNAPSSTDDCSSQNGASDCTLFEQAEFASLRLDQYILK